MNKGKHQTDGGLGKVRQREGWEVWCGEVDSCHAHCLAFVDETGQKERLKTEEKVVDCLFFCVPIVPVFVGARSRFCG